MILARYDRPEWLQHRFDYTMGSHIGCFERTQQGKTHLIYQMADIAVLQNPGLIPVSLMPKSRDPGTYKNAVSRGWQIIGDWPPPKAPPWKQKPPGYVLWPQHLKGVPVQQNREHLARIFRRCLAGQFQQGESLTIADDAFNLAVLLDLNAEIEELLTAGEGGGAGIWLTGQKPSGTQASGSVTTFAYNQPTQFLLGREPLAENRKRFDAIGGVDTRVVSGTVANLPVHPVIVNTPNGPKTKNISEKLHIDLRGPFLSIVGV